MAVYSRTIGRQVTNGMPAWRAAMSSTNTLYAVGARWDAAGGYASQLVFPEGSYGGGLYWGLDGAFVPVTDTYGGSLFVPELGAHGSMIFGSTGEGILQEQLAVWDISSDAPAYRVFQQADYALNASQAAARGASWYFNQAEYDALPTAKKIPWSAGTGSPETGWAAGWDKTFPVGRAGWIIPAKCGDSELGNNRPNAFRYNSHAYIPPAMSGDGDGYLIINNRSWAGSFEGRSGPPKDVAAADWYATVWPSGRKKYPLHAMNVRTKVWSVIGYAPDFVNSYEGNILQPYCFVDPAAKRVYWTCNAFSNEALYWADFSAGIGAVTTGGPTVMTAAGGGGADFSLSHSNIELFVGTSGALIGRKLYYYKNGLNGLGMIDLSTTPPTIHRLTGVAGLPSGIWHMSLDQANATVYITVKTSSAVNCTKFVIPNDPTVAANYSLTTQSISLGAVSLDTTTAGYPYGHRSKFLSSLGGVILMAQKNGAMLAFRPNF